MPPSVRVLVAMRGYDLLHLLDVERLGRTLRDGRSSHEELYRLRVIIPYNWACGLAKRVSSPVPSSHHYASSFLRWSYYTACGPSHGRGRCISSTPSVAPFVPTHHNGGWLHPCSGTCLISLPSSSPIKIHYQRSLKYSSNFGMFLTLAAFFSFCRSLPFSRWSSAVYRSWHWSHTVLRFLG